MRRRLIVVFVAVSTMVALAFVVPLGFLVQRTAEDRAIDRARVDASAIVPTLVAGGTRAQIESAIGATDAGSDGRVTVVTVDGWEIGAPTGSVALAQALAGGPSIIARTDGGVEVVTSVVVGPDAHSAIRVFVPADQLRQGQWRAWTILAAVGLALVGISVLVADRLARSIVRPAQDLALAADRLGRGDLEVRVQPSGPPELAALGGAFNHLGAQVVGMLERERELVAELSHRLRTPLTRLRMRVDQVDDAELAAGLVGDTDELTAVVNGLIAEARGMLTDGSADPDTGCNAAVVVGDRAEFWQVLAEDQGRPWRFEQDAGRFPVAVSEVDLAAAVDVLLDNVFAHTAEGVALAIGLEQVDERLRIRVEDGGTGIDPEDLDAGRSGSGSTGLGLVIARRTAESVGGSLEVGASDLGGAAVALVLPLTGGASRGPESSPT